MKENLKYILVLFLILFVIFRIVTCIYSILSDSDDYILRGSILRDDSISIKKESVNQPAIKDKANIHDC